MCVLYSAVLLSTHVEFINVSDILGVKELNNKLNLFRVYVRGSYCPEVDCSKKKCLLANTCYSCIVISVWNYRMFCVFC